MCSRDFRQSVLTALEQDISIRKAAILFGISAGTIQLWKKRPIPKKSNAGRPPKIDTQALLQDVETYPDAYLHERAERLNSAKSTVYDTLKRLKISKKTAQHPRSCPIKRSHFCLALETYQSQNRPIIYLDESGFKHHAYRPYGCSAKGTPCYGVHNWQLKEHDKCHCSMV